MKNKKYSEYRTPTAESAVMADLYHENEIRTNRIGASAQGIIGIFMILLVLGNELGIIDLISRHASVAILITGVENIILYVVSKLLKFDHSAIKYVILASMMIGTSIVLFYFPLNSSMEICAVIILSAMYYDKYLILYVTVLNEILYVSVIWLNVFLDTKSDLMSTVHAIQGVTLWKLPYEVLMYRTIPQVCLIALVAVICRGIARRGRYMINRQVDIASKVTKMDSELKIASEIQLSSMPSPEYRSDDGSIVVSAFVRPAKVVGGDFYDYFISGSDFYFLIADVSDKGLTAAMFMMKAKDSIRHAVFSGDDIEHAVSEVNSMLYRENPECMFITLWVACVNIHTGVGKYVNCGHVPPMLRHNDGTVDRIENEPELVLGIFENADVSSHPFRINNGDTILLFTDGMTDAVNGNGDHYGEERLRSSVSEVFGESCSCQRLVAEIDRFSDGTDQFDDMTAISISIHNSDAPLTGSFDADASGTQTAMLIDSVENALRSVGCPEDTRREIGIAVDEIAANLRDHAFPDGEGHYSFEYSAGENYCQISFTDNGIPFDPTQSDAPDFSTDLQIGGLGLFFVKNMVDSIDYKREDDLNKLTLLKIW